MRGEGGGGDGNAERTAVESRKLPSCQDSEKRRGMEEEGGSDPPHVANVNLFMATVMGPSKPVFMHIRWMR